MFDTISKRTVILLGATVLGVAATVVSVIKDRSDATCECGEECCCDACDACELADPTEV